MGRWGWSKKRSFGRSRFSRYQYDPEEDSLLNDILAERLMMDLIGNITLHTLGFFSIKVKLIWLCQVFQYSIYYVHDTWKHCQQTNQRVRVSSAFFFSTLGMVPVPDWLGQNALFWPKLGIFLYAFFQLQIRLVIMNKDS
jgi:hypothetical protein